ncbi:MAG: hypothetical protein ACOCRK_01640 [bacterium]
MKDLRKQNSILSSNYEEEIESYFDTLDENDEDLELTRESKLLDKLDPELVEYFSEARLIKKRSLGKKIKNKSKLYKTDDKIKYNNTTATIIYGPYKVGNKKMYEIETKSGDVMSISEDDIN